MEKTGLSNCKGRPLHKPTFDQNCTQKREAPDPHGPLPPVAWFCSARRLLFLGKLLRQFVSPLSRTVLQTPAVLRV